jgi:AAA family ATP:ADP antiporter
VQTLRANANIFFSIEFYILYPIDPLFGMGANVALIFSGQYVKWVSKMRDNLPPGVDPWGVSLKYLMSAVIASGGVMLGTFSYMQRNVMTDPNCVDQEKQAARKKKTKVKMGLRESAKVRIFFI